MGTSLELHQISSNKLDKSTGALPGLNVHDPEDQAKESAHDQGAGQDHVYVYANIIQINIQHINNNGTLQHILSAYNTSILHNLSYM